MKRVRLLFLVLFWSIATLQAQDAPAPADTPAAQQHAAEGQRAEKANAEAREKEEQQQREAVTAGAAAAVATGRAKAPEAPDFLEHLVDSILRAFDVRTDQNTPTRYAISAGILIVAFVLRRLVITVVFGILKRLASKTETTLDDKLFPALETPAATGIVVIGAVAAMKVLKLSPAGDRALSYGSRMAFALVIFWLLLRGFATLLDHAQEVAQQKKLGIAAFMPWIKKTLITIFVIFGVLMVAESLGADVKAFLAGLGIGGLAFALAAQDTIANIFGSVVVAIDQPFKIGETVQIGSHVGGVEDIGLRSTKLRKPDKSLVIIPNKTVAAEPVVNLSRFTQRRVEQTIGLTYDSKPEQMESIVEEIRSLILAEAEVDRPSVIVQFTNFGASSLDIWIVYLTLSPDFVKHLQLKQRINLKIMRAVAARGLEFAFPTQTVQLDGPVARRIADQGQKQP